MRPIKLICMILGFCLAQTGCGKNIYYYQTDGFSLKLQGRPSDVSQPVQGTLAFKERAVVIVPQKEKGDDTGEALSLISGFSFDKDKRDKDASIFNFGTLHIRSAVISGSAASELDNVTIASASNTPAGIKPSDSNNITSNGAVNAAKNVMGINGEQLPTEDDNAIELVDSLTPNQRVNLKKLVNKIDCQDAPNPVDKKAYEVLTGWDYRAKDCQALRKNLP